MGVSCVVEMFIVVRVWLRADRGKYMRASVEYLESSREWRGAFTGNKEE